MAKCIKPETQLKTQSGIALQTVNEVSGRKSTSRAKIKTACQEERRQKWKEHFKKPPEISDRPIQKE